LPTAIVLPIAIIRYNPLFMRPCSMKLNVFVWRIFLLGSASFRHTIIVPTKMGRM